MYSRSTAPSTICPGGTDSAWLARARIFSDIVWPVIEIGGCTGAAGPLKIALGGPKAFRDGRHSGPMAAKSTPRAAVAMLFPDGGAPWRRVRVRPESAPP